MSNKLVETHILHGKFHHLGASLFYMRIFGSRLRKEILPLCSALERLSAVSRAPQHRTSMDIQEGVQCRAQKRIKELQPLIYKERLRELGLSPRKKEGYERALLMCIDTWRRGEKRSERGSWQWYPVTESEAAGEIQIQEIPPEHH